MGRERGKTRVFQLVGKLHPHNPHRPLLTLPSTRLPFNPLPTVHIPAPPPPLIQQAPSHPLSSLQPHPNQ